MGTTYEELTNEYKIQKNNGQEGKIVSATNPKLRPRRLRRNRNYQMKYL